MSLLLPSQAIHFLLPLIFIAGCGTMAANPRFVRSNTTLPVKGMKIGAAYDGHDSIYLFGGMVASVWHSVYKYSVSKDRIERVGDWGLAHDGGAVYVASTGSLIYLGGVFNQESDYTSEVWRVNASTPSDRSLIGHLPHTTGLGAAVWDAGHENVYLLGGVDSTGREAQEILRFKPSTGRAEVLPARFPYSVFSPGVVVNPRSSDAYMIGSFDWSGAGSSSDIFKFDTRTEELSLVNVSLPRPTQYACNVWTTGGEVYVIGGEAMVRGRAEYHGVLRFNPDLNRVEEVNVDGFPPILYRHSCVFVEKLNRVYMFGGSVNSLPPDDWVTDSIMYIDLGTGTENPCADSPDGTVIPDPLCCKTYYRCFGREKQLHYCPEGMAFSLAESKCVDQAEAKCHVEYGGS